jgi:hypothetical protein
MNWFSFNLPLLIKQHDSDCGYLSDLLKKEESVFARDSAERRPEAISIKNRDCFAPLRGARKDTLSF